MFDFKHLELKKVNHILCVLYTDNVYFIDDYMQHHYHSETANYKKKIFENSKKKCRKETFFSLLLIYEFQKKSFFSSKSYGLVVNEECEKIFLTEASKSYQLG